MPSRAKRAGWFVVLSVRAIWGFAEKGTVVLEELLAVFMFLCVYVPLQCQSIVVSCMLEILPALIAKKTTYLV